MIKKIGRKAQGGVIVKKMLVGGLITAGIKTAIKKLGKKTISLQRDAMAKDIKQHRKMGFKTSYKTKDMTPTSIKLKRVAAKEDMRQGIRTYLTKKSDKAKIKASGDKAFGPGARLVFKSLRKAQKRKKKLN